MKKILAIILVLFTFCLSGCEILNQFKEEMAESIIVVKNFCALLVDDDIESAKKFLHPDSRPYKVSLSNFVNTIEQTHNIDFSNGITFENTTSIRSTYYDSSYDGSVYEVGYKLSVGGVLLDFFFIVVKNNNGYGIYDFGVEK